MVVDFAAFWLPKDGARASEYEDAFAPAALDDAPRTRLRCAVADGASESAYARLWARQLVGEFTSGGLTGPDLVELPRVGRRWADEVSRILARDEPAWYLERKAEEGAFAAFIGLEFVDAPGRDDAGTFGAIALGDSCFVQVREDAIERAFPIERAAAFDARPLLVPSVPERVDEVAAAIARYGGAWQSGDRFYVMSDALACWFLAGSERAERPWQHLDRFERRDRADFRQWVRALRRSSVLKNDDVTLLRLRVR